MLVLLVMLVEMCHAEEEEGTDSTDITTKTSTGKSLLRLEHLLTYMYIIYELYIYMYIYIFPWEKSRHPGNWFLASEGKKTP